jgi:hypothetical protein
MKTIEFSNPVFKAGINFTVRLGEKWKEHLTINEFVFLNSTHYLGIIRRIITCPFGELPEEVIRNEHDTRCQSLDGLGRELKKVYPELLEIGDEELENTVVTAIGFWAYERKVN